MHLNAEELVDLAEGTRAESAAPHLRGCAQCRAQLDEMRAMISAVADVDVPEPSPLYWNHLSRRVQEAVAAERGQSGWNRSSTFVERLVRARSFQAGIVAFASLLLVVFATSRVRAPRVSGTAHQAAALSQPAGQDSLSDVAVDTDPSLTLVATLTSTLDAEARAEAGLARVGSAEHAVAHMNGAELRELHRLLQEEMAP